MSINDYCPSCGRALPAEGISCPYCMHSTPKQMPDDKSKDKADKEK